MCTMILILLFIFKRYLEITKDSNKIKILQKKLKEKLYETYAYENRQVLSTMLGITSLQISSNIDKIRNSIIIESITSNWYEQQFKWMTHLKQSTI